MAYVATFIQVKDWHPSKQYVTQFSNRFLPSVLETAMQLNEIEIQGNLTYFKEKSIQKLAGVFTIEKMILNINFGEWKVGQNVHFLPI